MSLRVVITQNIKAQRLRQGLTQLDLADSTGFQVQYISRLETTPQNISVDILEKLAIGLHVSVLKLVGSVKRPEVGKDAIELFNQTLDLLNAFRGRVVFMVLKQRAMCLKSDCWRRVLDYEIYL